MGFFFGQYQWVVVSMRIMMKDLKITDLTNTV